MQKKQSGFTLIELILVIVILSVLAAIALPRFVDLQSKAQISVVEGVEGAFRSTSAIFHSQALVDGVYDGSLIVDGQSFEMEGGYIRGHWNNSWRHVLNLSQDTPFTNTGAECGSYTLCGVGFQSTVPGGSLPISTGGVRGLVLVWPQGYMLSNECYAYYFNPETGDAPSIGSVIDGC